MFKTLLAGSISLTEAGKVFAKRNTARLKSIKTVVEEMLAELPEEEPIEGDVAEAARMVEAMLKQSDSIDGKRALIYQAIKDSLKDPLNPDRYVYCYIMDLFDAAAVYRHDEGLYQVPYVIDSTSGAAKATLGQAVEVQIAYVSKQGASEAEMDESASLEVDFVPLVEKAVRSDGTVSLKLIDPGWGSSGYYSKEVIKRDGPRVFGEGLKMFADHPTAQEEAARPERSIKDLAAVLTSPSRWEDAGPDGPGLYAEAKVYDAWRGHIDAMATDIGVSIRALGKARMGEAEGRKGPIVESIAGAKSVDFVTDAGRGGKILSLREAATQRFTGGSAPKAGSNSSKEENTMALSEAEQKQLLEDVKNLSESNKALGLQLSRLNEAHLVNAARDHARRTLAGINLPQVTRDRLVESLAMSAPSKDGVLDVQSFTASIQEAAKAEAGYLASLTGSGTIKGMGETFQESATEVKPEALAANLEAGFARLGLSESAAKVAAAGH